MEYQSGVSLPKLSKDFNGGLLYSPDIFSERSPLILDGGAPLCAHYCLKLGYETTQPE